MPRSSSQHLPPQPPALVPASETMGRSWGDHGEIMGFIADLWEKCGKNRGKSWETHGKIHFLNEGFMGCIAGL